MKNKILYEFKETIESVELQGIIEGYISNKDKQVIVDKFLENVKAQDDLEELLS